MRARPAAASALLLLAGARPGSSETAAERIARDAARAKEAAAHAYDTYQRCGRRAALRLFATGE